uniref:DUF4870 domain-containing protein n=1 Tax=Schlesneria paludicola TaxID=360056 RepID=A0A7C2K082_9PLAN
MNDELNAATAYTKEERLFAVLCHLSTFITLFFLANLIVPLVIWILKRDSSEFVRDQGKEVLNWQISCMIYFAVSGVLVLAFIGIPLLILVAVFHMVMSIVGAIKAWDGVAYRYPLTIRLL